MTTITTDVAIIGAGPAGLACIIKLIDEGFTGHITLIDQGRRLESRICPVDQGLICNGCSGTCNVISGLGGSLHYGDAAKLSWFPSGRRLYKKLGTKKAEKLASWCSNKLFNIAKNRYIHTDSSLTPHLEVKNYKIVRCGEQEIRKKLEKIRDFLTKAENIKLLFSHKVTSLKKDNDDFILNVSHRVYKKKNKYVIAKKVVVATGRKGLFWWKKTLVDLNINHSTPTPSVGFRFEMPREFLLEVGEQHPDFKLSRDVGNIKVKTFCLCAGKMGGRIKYIDYGPFVLLDGHLIEEGETLFPVNFALLAQLKDSKGNARSFDWVLNNLIPKYAELTSHDKPKPVIQWYDDFVNKDITLLTVEEIINTCEFQLSIKDLKVGNLASLISKPIHDAFTDTIFTLIKSFTDDNKNIEDKLRKIVVIGLELEGLWDEIEMFGESFESSVEGLFVAGDSAGLAQGILQAAVTGAAIAEEISNNSTLIKTT